MAVFVCVAAELQDSQGAAVLMNCCAQLVGSITTCNVKHLRQQKMAYLMAAAAALHNHKMQPDQGKGSLSLAKKMCTYSRTAAQKLAALQGQTTGHTSDASDVFALILMCR